MYLILEHLNFAFILDGVIAANKMPTRFPIIW